MPQTQAAVGYITQFCPTIGAFNGTSAANDYLSDVADEMDASAPTRLFPARYKEHVACALRLVASYGFLAPPAAIASVYLATRFEFWFRVLSGRLAPDGTWLNPNAKSTAIAAISDKRLNRPKVSDLALAYKLMQLDQSRAAVRVFRKLDSALFSAPMTAGGKSISDLGERISYIRNHAGHGEWGDVSSESIFYGLLTAIIFYNQN
jgi:hypothetical protein